MISAPPSAEPQVPSDRTEERVVLVSESCLRLIDPLAAAGLPACRTGRLPWRLRRRIWKARLEFRMLAVRRIHARLVETRLRLRLRWLRFRHGRRVPALVTPAPPPGRPTS